MKHLIHKFKFNQISTNFLYCDLAHPLKDTMKRSTASASLNSDMKQYYNINTGQVLNETSKYDDNKENKTVTFSDQDSDESIMKPPLQSTSSGYYSLDETEGEMWRSDPSDEKSYRNSNLSNAIFKPERVSTAKKGCMVTSDIHSPSFTNLSQIKSIDSFCHTNEIEIVSHTTKKEDSLIIEKAVNSSEDSITVESFDKISKDTHHTKLHSPGICDSCRGSFADWEETYNICEKTILNQTKKIIESEVKVSQKDDELKKINIQLKEAQNIKKKMEERNEELANCLMAINNILLLEEDDVLRSQINEVLENVDVIGDIEDDVFEENPKTISDCEKSSGNTKQKTEKIIPIISNIGSTPSYTSSGYSSTEDEREQIDRCRLYRKAHDPRRHSIAPSTLKRIAYDTKKDRRNSMVIKNTIKVGKENDSTEEEAFIDSIQIDGKTIKSDRTLRLQNEKQMNRSDYRRHSTKAISHLYSSIVNTRRQSSYIPSQNSNYVKGKHETDKVHNKDRSRPLSCSNAIVDTSIPKVVSGTRVGYPRKMSPLKKQHSFNKSNLSVGKKCNPCGIRFKIGAPSYKCSDCLVICHLECMHIISTSCHSMKLNSKNVASTSEKYKNYFQSPLLFEADI